MYLYFRIQSCAGLLPAPYPQNVTSATQPKIKKTGYQPAAFEPNMTHNPFNSLQFTQTQPANQVPDPMQGVGRSYPRVIGYFAS
ncbi:hypothetical protein GDO86_012172 [Hymenochirus boettgeri]|uniref:Uncharacterized protein n=1 Tax=Hymenochirus boettgeri TaxID=247094 RepID=A0A8T2IPK9_9PIPI|nr:hypothetical protein GDO86_012172 [Hymenochirus boettgeri]